jgi:serine/threonine-protein kinase
MEPPIPSGTVLQNRYHLIDVLGQGGFGRTYLAEDQGRFNERCAIKELIPPETGEYALQKSQELFQREAESLYKISHPQVPQFRANFEQDGRLFLVQDYVEGKTYRQLLNDRKAQTYIQGTNPNAASQASGNGAFSEADVRQLLEQLLPVLDHIHSRNIIHRDITPDNIIRRNSDGLPMLIDFGVVRRVATQILTSAASAPVTTVGKVGYAPSEQIQSGRAYPSSDLYSLAATAVVLLTGKEPQQLYDDRQLTWNWRQGVNVSDQFANVLNRMLGYRPGDRYQSAMEVLQAIQGRTPVPPPAAPPPASSQRPDPNVSEMATMAVGRPPQPERETTRVPQRREPSIGDPIGNTIWDNPAVVLAIGAILALAAGLGSWALVRSLREPDPIVTATPIEPIPETPLPTIPETPLPTPTITVTPEPTPTVTPTQTPTPTKPTSFSQRLNLVPGQTSTQSGNLQANATVNYIFRGEQDQRLTAILPTEGVLMTLLGPDGKPVGDATRVRQWQGALPFTGNYTLQLRPVQGLEESDYKLELNLRDSAPATPTETPPVVIDPEAIKLPDQNPLQLTGQTTPQRIKRYLVQLQQGQQLTVQLEQGNGASLNVRSPNGQIIPNASGVKYWQNTVPRGGEYQIDVVAQQPTKYVLNVSSTTPGAAPPTPAQ